MKLRSATPVSRISRVAKTTMFAAISTLMVVGTIPFVNQSANADQYDDKIAALTANMAQYQAQADALNAQADSLANEVAQLVNQENALQSQINLNQAQYDQLVVQIADTQTQIQQNQDELGKTIADLYIDEDTSPIELLASSTNIGDFLNKQEYRTSVKNELNTTITKVKTLKAQLVTQQASVTTVLNQQKSAHDSLASQEAQQASLLAETQDNEANYQSMIASSASQIAAAKATQAALRARSNATGGYTLVDAGSLPDYPWNSSNCPMSGYMSTEGSDGNGGDGHGYGCRQCVSYVAYRIAKATGIYFSDLGNGGQVTQNLISKHGWTNLGSTPEAGSVASLFGNPGHTAYVEAVDGNKILVTQYNYDYGTGYGMYSEMWLSANFFNQYVKP